MAAIRLRDAAILAELQVVVANHLTRRENAILRLRHALQIRLDPVHPIAYWVGQEMYNAIPINTTVRQFALKSIRDGLHVLELFGGIGLGVLHSALVAGHKIRCYTYVDKNAEPPHCNCGS